MRHPEPTLICTALTRPFGNGRATERNLRIAPARVRLVLELR